MSKRFEAMCRITRKTEQGSAVQCYHRFNNEGDYLAHMHQLHGTRKSVAYRRRKPSMWRTPTRKPFTPEGVTVGANVVLHTMMGRQAGWQVWSQGESRDFWWIANGSEYVQAHVSDLSVVGQCVEDVTLFAEAS